MDWITLNRLEHNELEYAKRRRLIDDELQNEDYEPYITDVEFPGETAEEFYRREWLDETKRDLNGDRY